MKSRNTTSGKTGGNLPVVYAHRQMAMQQRRAGSLNAFSPESERRAGSTNTFSPESERRTSSTNTFSPGTERRTSSTEACGWREYAESRCCLPAAWRVNAESACWRPATQEVSGCALRRSKSGKRRSGEWKITCNVTISNYNFKKYRQ